MTRFKESKRIENAIEHKDRAALQWALGYCTMRIQIATRKDHVKHWRKIEAHVKAALGDLDQGKMTIYVRLLDEGTDVWRPVEAMRIVGNAFEIVGYGSYPEDEIWEFVPGQRVHCKERVTPEGEKILVAVTLATTK